MREKIAPGDQQVAPSQILALKKNGSSKTKIVIVDDDGVNQIVMQKNLCGKG